MSALENYLLTLTSLRGATVPETSYYAAVQTLLDEAGAALRPNVRAVIHPKDSGAGIPDLGLYDEQQPPDQKPARGIVEAKPVSDDLLKIANGEQVARYVAHYGQALVTNYYQFVLVTRDPQTGKPVIEERYDIAPDASAFWESAAQARPLAAKHAVSLREYLKRALRRNAPLTTPQDVAWMLASYAREAKARVESGGADLTALENIRKQLEAALGVRFEDAAAEDFFRSTLVQTLFYGLFSAWVLWNESHSGGDSFDLWRDTRRMNVPVISELFSQFSAGTQLPQSVEQVLVWTANALNRVDRAAFFAVFNKGEAVQYFYEPFLEAFDPDLRRQLGVWYTPPEVVEYMVARVDAALRDELGIADGLADPSVYVLDPCCGTGAYLVGALRHIYNTLRGREGEALAAQAVATAMRERVFGFEILPAPFVVAHLQIGTLLNGLRAPLAAGQRAGVYLTNALTGWEADGQPRTDLMFPELKREREAADTVKRQRPILVVIGNPPYSGFAGVAVAEEQALTQAYRTTQNPGLPRPQGQGLNDLYVRFFRMAERRIVEGTGRGIISFISNYSWLDGLSHPGMRERYLDAFDHIYIDNLNGDRYSTGKTTPEGLPDPSIFSTDFNREGIQVGTAIATLIRKPAHNPTRMIHFRHLWGTSKRAQLRTEAVVAALPAYESITPSVEIGLPFKPRTVTAGYLTWARLPELFPVSFPGVNTGRDGIFVSIDREKLLENIAKYFKERGVDKIPHETLYRYNYRPFDLRYVFWDVNELDRARPEYIPHVKPENIWLLSQQRVRRDWAPPQAVTKVGSMHLEERGGSYFPLYLYPSQQAQLELMPDDAPLPDGRKPNLSDKAAAYLATTFTDGTPLEQQAETLFFHALATLHSPAYRAENAGALRQDWPRVPLPSSRAALQASAALGKQLAALLDVEMPVPGVTQGDPRPELRTIAVLATRDGSAPDFTVNAGWGHFGAGSAVMPGRGRAVGENDSNGGSGERGANTVFTIYLNDTTCWQGIPVHVWDYTLGGYQVLKKWLSYRETAVLGRPLKPEEARDFMYIARRIAALLALNPALDANYRATTS